MKKKLITLATLGLLSLTNLSNAQSEKPFFHRNHFQHVGNDAMNKMTSQTEKENYYMTNIAPKDSARFKNPGTWECYDFVKQDGTEHQYFPELDTLNTTNFKYSLEEHGKHKIKYAIAKHKNEAGIAHATMGIITGNDLRDFNSWLFLEPQDPVNLRIIKPGEHPSMNENTWLDMEIIDYWENYVNNGDTLVRNKGPDILKFTLTNGIATLDYVYPLATQLINPALDRTSPEIVTNLEQNKHYNNLENITITTKDDTTLLHEYLYTDLNGVKDSLDITDEYPTFRIAVHEKENTMDVSNLQDGNYTLNLKAKNINLVEENNETDTIIYFTIDKTNPLMSMQRMDKTINLHATDTNFDRIEVKINGNPQTFYKNDTTFTVDNIQKNNYIEAVVFDKAGNIRKITDSWVGINNLEKELLKVYPNPTSGDLNFNYNSNFSGEVSIYNLQGQEITNKEISQEKEFNVNLSDKAAGTYIYRITSEDGKRTTGKIVKK